MKRLALIVVLTSLCTAPTYSCTSFVLGGPDGAYFGKNLDWSWADGMVLVNPRNLQKRAFVNSTNPATWTAKFGSVTFNQFGRELPFGGMNEAGLVIENMWLDDTRYPAADDRPEINMLQWIQYQLDSFSTVDEVIASDKTIRLESPRTRARIHYLVADARGNSATIEFLDGVMKVHQGKELPYPALANDTYARSASVLKTNAARGSLSEPMPDKGSLTRFCRAAARAKAFEPSPQPTNNVAFAFETLEQVRQGKYTVWQLVYDLTNRRIHFRTTRNPQERTVDLKTLDFACTQPARFADIHADASASGAVVFRDLVAQEHHQLLKAFYNQESLKRTVGDLTAQIEPLLFTIQSYQCLDQ